MNMMLIICSAILFVHLTDAYPDAQKPQSPLGVRYSSAADVSRIAYNSPLVMYGSDLNEIQLPAKPIQPANLKQVAQNTNQASDTEILNQQQLPVEKIQTAPSVIKTFESQNAQLLQSFSPKVSPKSEQFLSIQQFPANPQYQTNDVEPVGNQQPVLNQNLPLTAQSPIFSSYQFPQQQKLVNNLEPIPTYPQPTATRSQLVYSASTRPQSVNSYFATGPFAQQARAQYIGNNLATVRNPVQFSAPLLQYKPITPQYVTNNNLQVAYPNSPAANLVSQVRFNGISGGFSYGF